ncbi:recombinase family protein [Neobacillus sp. MM2021_6]|uniref:recombinase family protein n=1 Tax=Bacillaceae TaxID=186817 RepID=UPI00140BE8D6|nr:MULTISPECIES: recombinase family protein [Bacillaceae]MBO0961491.1 recombinase family protein [Neobacillus sp. MM2021_6]NHC19595.1 recombinase family protein [Bacillus sp. MM2020_4]
MRAALYIRVSTQEQVENYSIESQKERLEAYCKSKGWAVYDVYIDPGYSGSNTDRPALQRLLADLNNIDVVVVYKLDRLSRSQRDTLDLIEEYFLKNSVEFVSITETLDTSTPFGKAMIGILSVFAQLERETIAERMRMGLIKRAEEGYRSAGGNYDPAGYGRGENGELFIKEEEALHIKTTYDLYEQYHSITKVQEILKELEFPVWRFRRYNDILRAKLYCGYVSFAGTYYKGLHDPIVTEEQFNRVQVLLSRHKGHNAHKAKEALLSGLIICGHCGENFVSYLYYDKLKSGEKKKYRYYLCRAKRFPSEYTEKCTNKNWNGNKLEKLIIDEIQNSIIDKKTEKSKTKKINYDKLIKKVDEKMERTLALYVEGNMPVALLNKQIDALEQEKKQLQNKKEIQEKQLEIQLTDKELKQYTIDLQSADFPTRQAVIQKLIKQIIIHNEDVEIVWNF